MSTPSTLASIFTNPEMKKEIHRVNGVMMSFSPSTIEESFLFGAQMDTSRSIKVHQVKDQLLQHLRANYQLRPEGGRDAYWDQYKIYNKIEISVLNIRSQFIADLKLNSPKLHYWIEQPLHTIPQHVLRDISLVGFNYPNITWALKIVALIRDDNTILQSNTSPCRRATEMLFGEAYKDDQLGHTQLCHRISQETGLKVLDVNTALWILGQRFK